MLSQEDDDEPRRPMNDTTMPPPPPRHMNDTTMPPPKKAATRVMAIGNDVDDDDDNGPPVRSRRHSRGLRKGFGLHDWALLTKQAKDLAQRKGAPLRQISPMELKEHSDVHDGWCALKGKVYNVSPYLPYHPGGEAIMHKALGRDATALFEKYHRWVNIDG